MHGEGGEVLLILFWHLSAPLKFLDSLQAKGLQSWWTAGLVGKWS
jgi:hypothetical protein